MIQGCNFNEINFSEKNKFGASFKVFSFSKLVLLNTNLFGTHYSKQFHLNHVATNFEEPLQIIYC